MIDSSVPTRVRFPRDDGFHATLKRGAAEYFARTGSPRWGGARMHVKTAVILGGCGASSAALLGVGGPSAWLAAALAASRAVGTAAIGFSVMHDANHGA